MRTYHMLATHALSQPPCDVSLIFVVIVQHVVVATEHTNTPNLFYVS